MALPAAELLRRVRANTARSVPVHIVGNAGSGAQKVGFDLSLRDATSGMGTVTASRSKLQIIRVGGTVYIKGGDDFYEQFAGGKEVGKLLQGKWLKGSANTPQLRDLAKVFTTQGAFSEFLPKAGTKLTKRPVTTVAGRQVVPLQDPGDRATLFVSVDQPEPLPVRITGSDAKTSGTLDFRDWGQEVTVTAPPPAQVIDTSKIPRRP